MWTLVTGASGFVGSHIVAALVKARIPVIALQRTEKSLSGVPDQDTDDFKRVIGDLNTDIDIDVSVTSVIHCAAAVVLPGATAIDFAEGNVLTAVGAIRLIRKIGAKRIFLMSSVSVYGGGNRAELTENSDIISPQPYGTSKYLVEQMFEELAEESLVVILRTPGIVGRGANPNWLTKTVERIRNGEELTITNPNAEFNQVLHVCDVIGFLLFYMSAHQNLPKISKFNIVASGVKTIAEIISEIKEYFSSCSNVRIEKNTTLPARIISDGNTEAGRYIPLSISATISRYLEEQLEK